MLSDPRCPICDGASLTSVVSRTGVPVHQHALLESQRAALAAPRGDLTIVACDDCGFVFNRTFDAGRLEYGAQYDNTQLSSPFFQEYVNGLVRHLLDDRGVRASRIVEVGCGKGDFVRALVAPENLKNTGVGFDPSYVGADEDLDGRLRFERRFYDESCADVPADVVVSRHVIEHVPEPLRLLRSIHAALAQRPGARLFLETPCVEWILQNVVIWDFFYEHCSLFTRDSLVTACERAGFTVDAVRHVFGGQYLWLEATNTPPKRVTRAAGHIPALAARFSEAQARQRERWASTIRTLSATERLALWGAGAKGITFANEVDPGRAFFACMVDVNPAKQGCFAAGTGHPIVSPFELAACGITVAVVLNPNYHAEVEALLRAAGSAIAVVNLGTA